MPISHPIHIISNQLHWNETPADTAFFFNLCLSPRDLIFWRDYLMRFTSGVDFLISSIIIIFIKLSLFFLYFFRICPCCFLEAGCSSDCCHDLLTTLEDFGFRFGYEPIFFRFSIWLFIFDLLKLFLLPPFLVCLPFFICNYKDHMRIILNNTSISCSKINI